MVYCLGIDESNNGRFPEIHAGVFTNHSPDWRKGEFCKHRRKTLSIDSVLRENNLNRIYRHTLTPIEHTKVLGKESLVLVSIAELIRCFFEEDIPIEATGGYDNLEKVLIDGNKDQYGRDKLKELIHPYTPKIEFIPGGDKKYRIVNLADMTAYRLFRGYTTGSKSVDERLGATLLTPRLEDYVDFFRQDRRIY